MSTKKKYLTDEDLKKFDDFIQNSLNKYFYVDPWDKLYTITGADHHDIISDKSTIPDLVIYNKTFNKNDCFLQSNKKKYIKFPRVQFLLRPKRMKNFDPSCTYGDEKKGEKKNVDDEKEEITQPFEFKSIPKELESKFIGKDINSEKNLLFDELKEFMKSDKDNSNEIKVKLISENENENKTKDEDNNQKKEKNNQKQTKKGAKKENNGQKRKNSNQGNYQKNKFGLPININKNNNIINNNINNNIIYNNYFNYQKMLQNMRYQNFLYKMRMNNVYDLNNNQNNKFNPSINENKIVNNNNNNQDNNQINNNNFNNSNTDNKNNNNTINAISYFKNTDGINEKDEFEKYINNFDEILKNYRNKRNWKVVDNRTNIAVNKFNSEELYYFLNTVITGNDNNNYSICDLEKDFYFNPVDMYERLKNMFQKD